MSLNIFLFLASGLVLLIIGAELLVRGAARLANTFNIPPLIIGLTIVAFGTSAPELAVSAQSAWHGQGDLAIGNVVGSNILNLLLILGLSALITPLMVARQLVRLDIPLMIGASLLAWLLALDGSYSRLDGAVLFAGIIAYTGFLLFSSLRNQAADDSEAGEYCQGNNSTIKNLVFIALGLAMLVYGSKLLVNGAVSLAQIWQLSELVIGLTVLAVGTSLPELATSLTAALKGERDIAVGNIVGSNVFNLLSVFGFAALVSPNAINIDAQALRFDYPIMLGVSAACLPLFFIGYRVGRWAGATLLTYYVIYTTYLILVNNDSPLAASIATAMLGYVIPATLAIIVLLALRSWQQTRGKKAYE